MDDLYPEDETTEVTGSRRAAFRRILQSFDSDVEELLKRELDIRR
jgi:hypothetical protein